MIYRKRQLHTAQPGGFHRFQNVNKNTVYGFGAGDYIRLRDEFGNIWRGSAEKDCDNVIRYRFRDEKGRSISGMADSYGVILRDDRGNTWRGFVD
jgi:hypothetical protein